VFENRLLIRIYGPRKQQEVIGGLRNLHNEDLYNLYSSPNIIWVIKSRRMLWAGHWRDQECLQNFCQKTWRRLGRPRCR